MDRPVGSNPWKYNQLPQHLKDFIEKEKGYTGETRNGVYIDPITSFNQMDRRSQDHLIMTMDQENLRRRQNEQRLAQAKADMDAIKNSPYQPSSSLSPTDFDYNALPAENKYNYLSIPDWAKRYINPAMGLGYIEGVQLSNPYAGLRSFDMSDRANQDAALRAAGNKYAYDLAQGKIKAPTAPKAQSGPVANGGFASGQKPITYASDRMANAIRSGVSAGKLNQSQLNNVHNRDMDANVNVLVPNGTTNSALLEAMNYGVPLELRKTLSSQAQSKGVYNQYQNRPSAQPVGSVGGFGSPTKPGVTTNSGLKPVPMPKPSVGPTTNKSNTSSATATYKPPKKSLQWVWDDPKEKAAWDSATDKNTYTYLKDNDFMSNVPLIAIGRATPEAEHQFNKDVQSYYLSGEWKSKIPQKTSAYKNTNNTVPMPRKNTNSTLTSSLV
jgi:hypothetical protein